jgi:hypothetical protein
MKRVIATLLLAGGLFALASIEANAVVCARGVVRAGCVSAGGAAVVATPVGRPVVHPVVVAPRAAVRRRVY